jgi:hypothetical protein
MQLRRQQFALNKKKKFESFFENLIREKTIRSFRVFSFPTPAKIKMKFNYQFSNLLGTVYQQGNVVFSPDGSCLYSPVGKRVSAFDLIKYVAYR